jgi:nitrite reductase/ring-hydroxylating ferredoxin subunit
MKARGMVFAIAALIAGVVSAVAYGIASSHGPDTGELTVSLESVKEEGVLKIDRAEDIFVVWHEGQLIALSADAQHVGDDVVFCESSQLFESPAHGEKFDLRGFYYAGPGARGLDRYPVREEGGIVFVDGEHPQQGAARGEGPPLEPAGPFCIPT